MKEEQKKLYRCVTVSLLTQLDDGTIVWPGEVAYVEATHKEIAYAHARCESCLHFVSDKCQAKNGLRNAHPKDYCSNFQTKVMIYEYDEIN